MRGINHLAWRFVCDLFTCFTLGRSWVKTIIAILGLAGLIGIAIAFDRKMNIQIPSLTIGVWWATWEPSVASFLSIVLFFGLSLIAIGFAIGRWRSGILTISDSLECDPEHHFFRLEITNDGPTLVRAKVDVKTIKDDEGKYVLDPKLGVHEIHWSRMENLICTLGRGDSHTVGLLWLNPDEVWIALGTLKQPHQQIDKNTPESIRKRFWVEVLAKNPDHLIASKWFAVDFDKPTRSYRASPGTPPFIKPSFWERLAHYLRATKL